LKRALLLIGLLWSYTAIFAQSAGNDYRFKNVGPNTYIGHIYGVKTKPNTDTTFVYIGGAFPKQQLTVIIKDADNKFINNPPQNWVNKDVWLHGLVFTYTGMPVMLIRDTINMRVGYLHVRMDY
jgi:hypothetical protein